MSEKKDGRYYIDKDGIRRRKPLPKYGGIRQFDDINLNFSNRLELTADDFICQYTFNSESEFKFLLGMYLDKVRIHKGIRSSELSKRMGKDPSYFSATKFYGIATFEVFLNICSALSVNPVKAFDNCVTLFSELKQRKK